MSNYIHSRDSKVFGNHQEDYLHQSQRIVEETGQAIRDAVDQQADLTALFHALLSSLGEKRKAIARAHQTERAGEFGVLRYGKTFAGSIFATYFGEQRYKDYNQRLIDSITKQWNFVQGQTVHVEYPEWLGRKCFVDYTFSSDRQYYDLLDEFKGLQHTLLYQEAYKRRKEVGEMLKCQEDMRSLKENHSDAYYKCITATVLKCLLTNISNHSYCGYAKTTIWGEVQGKKTILTEALFFQYDEGPVSFSNALLLHLDPFLLEPLLGDIAKLFKEAVITPSSELQQIKERVALFKYYFSHSAPYHRGSAAIGEWMERAIYRSHGYEARYFDHVCSDLEALVAPLSTFWERYDQIVHIQK